MHPVPASSPRVNVLARCAPPGLHRRSRTLDAPPRRTDPDHYRHSLPGHEPGAAARPRAHRAVDERAGRRDPAAVRRAARSTRCPAPRRSSSASTSVSCRRSCCATCRRPPPTTSSGPGRAGPPNRLGRARAHLCAAPVARSVPVRRAREDDQPGRCGAPYVPLGQRADRPAARALRGARGVLPAIVRATAPVWRTAGEFFLPARRRDRPGHVGPRLPHPGPCARSPTRCGGAPGRRARSRSASTATEWVEQLLDLLEPVRGRATQDVDDVRGTRAGGSPHGAATTWPRGMAAS